MIDQTTLIYIGGGLILLLIILWVNRRRQIDEQVRHVKLANEPGYKAPKDDMEVFIKDGVITYRKRRKN